MFLLGLFLVSCTSGPRRERGPDVSRGVEASQASLSPDPPVAQPSGHEGDDWEPPLP